MRTRSILATAAALVVGWTLNTHCGDGGIGLTVDCNPPCPIGWSCVDGECVEDGDATDAPDAGDDAPDAETVPHDVPPDVPPDVVTDLWDTPRDVGPEAVDVRPDAVDVGPEAVDVRPDAVDGEATTVRNTGAPCDTDSDCLGPDATCLDRLTVSWIGELVFTNGYCSSSCGAGGDCGPDGYCVDARPVDGPIQCMLSCSTDAECRSVDGYSCTSFMIFPETFCAPI
ncbi:MAG: hypothetical protein JXB32_23890 [Deltaproteobacteria bacterium]|nr:hypothetical protein [Deltaproteobacteria bacterium]